MYISYFNHILNYFILQHKLSGNDTEEKTEEDFQLSADIDFYIDKVEEKQNKQLVEIFSSFY